MGDTTDDETEDEDDDANDKKDEKKREIEIMSTYTDNENDTLFSFKSTFQNDAQMHTNKGALVHRMKTIETDTTFPSIPALAADSGVHKKSSCDTVNTTNTMQAPIPESHPASIAASHDGISSKRKYKVSESGSTLDYEVHPSSYLTICEKCGTAHANNLGDCTPFIKFNKNQY